MITAADVKMLGVDMKASARETSPCLVWEMAGAEAAEAG